MNYMYNIERPRQLLFKIFIYILSLGKGEEEDEDEEEFCKQTRINSSLAFIADIEPGLGPKNVRKKKATLFCLFSFFVLERRNVF